MTRRASRATPTFWFCASSTSRFSVSVCLIVSLLTSKTLSFFRNCSAVMRSSSFSLSMIAVSRTGILRFTIFFSMAISCARLRSDMRQTCISLFCLTHWILYFFSSLARSFLSSFVASSPSCWRRMMRRSMSSFRTWLRWASYSRTRIVTSPHWCCIRAAWNWVKCEKQRKVQTIPKQKSKLFFMVSRSSRLRTPRKVSCSDRRSRLAGSVQTRSMHFAP
mmetsp:Transcript_69593/g.157926  ORF Transcript_69593/g.157926 Transcript_69593/m.157926 type:complete len:220 (-) Transcript_69593:178-837(-)